MDSSEDSRKVPQLDWQTMPIELLCLIFNMLDVTALTRCMFLCVRWNKTAQYVAERKGLWKDIVTKYVVDTGESSHLKSVDFNWRDCFINQLLWNHVGKADLFLKRVYSVTMIKNIHVFKGQDFEENNEVILKIVKHNSLKTLYLYGKLQITDFNIDDSNAMQIDKVVHYRLVENCCYVLDQVNNLIRYKFLNDYWTMKHMGRYYGGDEVTVDLHVFKEDIFVMLRWGDILAAKTHCGFEKAMDIPIPCMNNCSSAVFVKMFHRFGIIFGVGKDVPFHFNCYDVNQEKTFLFICPDLTCVTEHGEVLIVGHSDGKVKIYTPRNVSEQNILQFEKSFIEIPEIENDHIVAVEVFEEKGRNHLFIATHSHVAHVIFDHKNMDEYIWNEYPFKVSVMTDISMDEV